MATVAEQPAVSRRMLLGFKGTRSTEKQVRRRHLRRSRCEAQIPTRKAQPASHKAAQGQSTGWADKALCGRTTPESCPERQRWKVLCCQVSGVSVRSHRTPASSPPTSVHEHTQRERAALHRLSVHVCAWMEWKLLVRPQLGRQGECFLHLWRQTLTSVLIRGE